MIWQNVLACFCRKMENVLDVFCRKMENVWLVLYHIYNKDSSHKPANNLTKSINTAYIYKNTSCIYINISCIYI